MNETTAHGPRTVVPPPLLYAVAFLAGIGLHRLSPGDTLPAALAVPAHWVGIVLVVAGAALSLSGVTTFFRAKTTTIPHKVAAKLVIHGPYRFTRNPMYVGLNTVYIGLMLALDRLWPLALLPAAFVILLLHVVRPEERHLEERFGENYRAYRARVRRFL